MVVMGKAPDPAEYNCTEENGIQVCVRNDVQTRDDEIRINYSKLLFKESLTVDGLAY